MPQRRQIRLLVASLAALLVLVAPSPVSAQEVANPAYEAWKNFNPGSRTRVAGSTKTMGMETGLEITTTLKSVTPEKVTLEVSTTTTVANNRVDHSTQLQEVPAVGKAENLPTPAGEERITVNGTAYNCKVYAIGKSEDGTTIIARTWMNEGVPGGVVRLESRSEGAVVSDTRLELKEAITK